MFDPQKRESGTLYSDLEDAHKPEHEHNDYDGDNQTDDTAHGRFLQDVSDDIAHNEVRGPRLRDSMVRTPLWSNRRFKVRLGRKWT